MNGYAGLSDDIMRQLDQERAAQQALRRPPVSPAQTKKRKGFLLDQISTGGGIGGALGGAALGAAAGSAVPIVGTAIGGILGALLGGAGGSAAGEVAENAITGDDLMTNVGNEALIGGVTSLPLGAGLKLARAGGAALKGSTKAASELVQEAGAQTIGKGTIKSGGRFGTKFDSGIADALSRLQTGTTANTGKTTVAGKLRASGDKALASQYGVISKPTIRQANPGQTIPELADMGLTNPVDVERVAGAITGADGILTQQVAKSVAGAKGVDTSTLRRTFTDALDNYGIVEKDRKSLQTLFDAQMNKLSGGARGSLSTTVEPTEVLATMRSFEKRIANLRGKGGNYRLSTPEREDMANALQLVRDELEDQLFVGAGANKNLSKLLTPELREKLVGLHPNNAAWAKHVDGNIMTATDIASLRSAQAPFVRAGMIIDEGADNAFSAGGRMVTSAGGIRDALLQGAQNVVKNPAARAYAGTIRAVTGGARKGVGQSLPGLTARQVGGRIVGAPLLSGGAEQSAGALADPQTMQDGMTEQAAPEQQTEPSVGGFTKSQLEQAMVAAAMDGNSTALQQIKTIYDMLPQEQEQDQKLNATTAALVAKQASGESLLDDIESLYGEAGGGQGVIGGNITNTLAGFTGGAAKTYNQSLAANARQLSRAMGEVGSGSNQDAQAYVDKLPLLTDSPEEAARKLRLLRQQLATARQNTLMYGTGVTGSATQEQPY